MIRAINFLRQWIIPPKVYEKIKIFGWDFYSVYFLLNKDKYKILDRNKIFKDCQKGERCFIVATGPSINNLDLTLLKGETVFSVSSGYLHKDYKIFSPKYHCIARLDDQQHKDSLRWLRSINSKLLSNTIPFFSIFDRGMVEEVKSFNERPFYLANNIFWGNFSNRDLDLTKPLPQIQTVPMICLQIAMYMGFKKIYLLGVDHDGILHHGKSTHFYSEKRTILKENWNYSFEEEVEKYLELVNSYKKIKNYADKREIKIFNATEGGLLEVFPRVEYSSLFRKKKKKKINK